MTLQLCIRRMAVSNDIKHWLHELCADIDQHYDGIQNIDIKIADINGPYKSGTDKRCHVKCRGRRHLSIDIETLDRDLDCAIDQAFRRLRKELARCHPGQLYTQVSNTVYAIGTPIQA